MDSNIKIIENYRNNENLRNEYYNIISKIFPGISFQDWYSKGFWTDKYIPFSIIESGKIISTASAALMNVLIDDKKYKAIQLGAVGTLSEYRNQGLSSHLLNYIINKYKSKIDFFFLYANETVLDFYPKFGFRSVKEYKFVNESVLPEPNYSARKLNIKVDSDYLLIKDLISNRQILTKRFGAEDYGFITMWHVLNLYPDNLYYLDKENIVIIKKENKNTLHILDVIFCTAFDFQSALPKIIESNSIKFINYNFPPDQLNYSYNKILSVDTELFILGNVEFGNNPFRFPLTAIT